MPVLKQRCEIFENSWTTAFRGADFSTLMRVNGSGLPPGPVTEGFSTSSCLRDAMTLCRAKVIP